MKDAKGLLETGHTVATDQLTLNDYKTPDMELKNVESANLAQSVTHPDNNDRNFLIVTGEDFRIEFSKHTGFMNMYRVYGEDLINEDSELTPNFWRAPTDNDYGAGLQYKYQAWNTPEMKKTLMTQRLENNQAIVQVAYDMPGVSRKLNLTYVINNMGAVKVTQEIIADKSAKISNMFRFGMQLPMPSNFENIEYYGRGPIENYIDRNNCTDLGIYSQKVADQFYPYIRPQENGNKTDIRW